MSADKHKNLAVRVAYLRLASMDGGLALNIKWARKLTSFLMRMIDDGEITLRRTACCGRKNVTVAYATEIGKARLEAEMKRFGPQFGPITAIGKVEPVRESKAMRRARRMPPEVRHEATKRRRIERERRQAYLVRFCAAANLKTPAALAHRT